MALRAGARRQPVIGCAAALVFGGLPALAFPAPSWWWLAWFGLVPLLLVVRAAPTSWEGALRAWTGMGGFVLATQYWLVTSAGPMLVLLAAGLGVLWLPAGWLAHRLLSVPVTTCRVGAALVVVPSAWVAAEAVRSWQSLGGPWALLGASQWSQPVTLASASLGGVWLTSFLLVATNTAIASVLVCRATGGRLVALGCVIGCAGLGPASYLLGSVPVGGPTVRVALVQAGDIADAAARLAAGEEFTAAVADQRPDLVVWGESSVGQAPLISYEMTFSDLTRHAARLGAALLVYQSSTSTFQGSWAQPQLAAQPAVRAVEAGIPAVHASLSGDSSAFDTRGRRLAWCSAEFNGAIVVNVPLASNVTLYLRLGDWVPVTAFVVMGAGFAVFLRRSLARVSDCADK
ncbi:apolipoprotein N-acyltransferase [Mycobacterium tuberculosis]|uniref:apolipoprotein N-acyltransferase n=1 Tax=Mycobacterium tuberculosis TaxID=1773 RepID=UPI0004F35188|nr:apolipoprotein N-acyltransferase [Mycobacterium tuberculosis]